MSDEEQRLAIAVACGVKPGSALPDYDLNAIHEAERTLDSLSMDERSKWLDYLALACDWPQTKNAAELRFETQYRVARATATQRREAFLRTKGLWRDD
jgi:hypothetical protein